MSKFRNNIPRATEYLLTHNDIAEEIPKLPNPEAKGEVDPEGQIENLHNIIEQIMQAQQLGHSNSGPQNNPGS